MTDRLRLDEWTSGEGQRRSKLQVVADSVDFLDRPKAGSHDPDSDVALAAIARCVPRDSARGERASGWRRHVASSTWSPGDNRPPFTTVA